MVFEALTSFSIFRVPYAPITCPVAFHFRVPRSPTTLQAMISDRMEGKVFAIPSGSCSPLAFDVSRPSPYSRYIRLACTLIQVEAVSAPFRLLRRGIIYRTRPFLAERVPFGALYHRYLVLLRTSVGSVVQRQIGAP